MEAGVTTVLPICRSAGFRCSAAYGMKPKPSDAFAQGRDAAGFTTIGTEGPELENDRPVLLPMRDDVLLRH